MINKQSLWFLTLFSLILVLSVYYITMPNELLLTNNSKFLTETTSGDVDDSVKVTVEENELLVTMRVNLEDERNTMIEDLKTTLTNVEASSEEKNSAYEQIKYINDLKAKEEQLEKKIKKEYGIDSFVKIDNGEVKVVAIKDKHDVTLANNIMRMIQGEFTEKVYVTIRFEK